MPGTVPMDCPCLDAEKEFGFKKTTILQEMQCFN